MAYATGTPNTTKAMPNCFSDPAGQIFSNPEKKKKGCGQAFCEGPQYGACA